MTKREYLDSLSGELGTMSYNDVKEIIAEIEEHFEGGKLAGKSEEEIAAGLGSPKELAAAYLGGDSNKVNAVLRKSAPAGQTAEDKGHNGPLFVVLFNALFAIPVWFVLFVLLLGGVALDAGMVIAIVRIAMKACGATLFMPGLIMLDVAVFFFALFLTCLLILLIKAFFKGTGMYVKWNRKVWDNGL